MSRVQVCTARSIGWLTARRAITASIVEHAAIVALIAATPGSPFHPVLPESQGNGPLGLLAKLLVPRPSCRTAC